MSKAFSEEEQSRKEKKPKKNDFIDDEAEVSDDEDVSEDELDEGDGEDLDLVDQDAPELDSEEEDEVRQLYHKQLESEDRRNVLLLQEQLEEKEVSIGQRRRRKFRYVDGGANEQPLRKHYDPDDDDSQDPEESDEEEGEEGNDDLNFGELKPPKLQDCTLSRFIYRDRQVVQALSKQDVAPCTRDEKDKMIQRELQKFHHSESVFDRLKNL